MPICIWMVLKFVKTTAKNLHTLTTLLEAFKLHVYAYAHNQQNEAIISSLVSIARGSTLHEQWHRETKCMPDRPGAYLQRANREQWMDGTIGGVRPVKATESPL